MERKKHPYSDLGLKLKVELLRRGITQRELAERTGIHHKVISDIVHGKNMKPEHWYAIRQCLDGWGDHDAAV